MYYVVALPSIPLVTPLSIPLAHDLYPKLIYLFSGSIISHFYKHINRVNTRKHPHNFYPINNVKSTFVTLGTDHFLLKDYIEVGPFFSTYTKDIYFSSG